MSEKRRYRVVYERSKCIGAAVCAAMDEKNFVMNADGLADLVGGIKKDSDVWEKIVELDEEGKKRLLEAAEGCPVTIIRVFDLETGKQLV